MASLVLLHAGELVAQLDLVPQPTGDWQATSLTLSWSAQQAGFALASALPIPASLLKSLPAAADRYRLIRDDEAADALAARLRDWLHSAARVQLDASAAAGAWFFGCVPFAAGSIQGQVQARAVLDFSAWLAPGNAAVDYGLRVAIAIEAVAEVAVRTQINGTAHVFQAPWRIAALFGAEASGTLRADIELDLPLPGLRLPRLALPGLSLDGISLTWPAWTATTMRCPEWLRGLADDYAVEADGDPRPTLSGANGRLQLQAPIGRLRLVRRRPNATQTVLTAHAVELDLNRAAGGGVSTEVRCASIETAALPLGDGALDAPFGLPLRVSWRALSVTPSVQLAAPRPQLRFRFAVSALRLALRDDADTFVQLDIDDIDVVDGHLAGSPRVRISDGAVSQEILVEIGTRLESAGQALERVHEIAVRASNRAAAAFNALLRFLARLFGTLALPSVGPVNAAWPALGKWLRGLGRELSIQFVLDTAHRRLLRFAVSGRDDGAGDASRRLLDALGFTLDATFSNAAQLALVVETAGTHAGDWFVIAVPPAQTGASWLSLTLATDLWLQREERSELAQDADPASGAPAVKPALALHWDYPARSALALAGVQQGRPRFFRQFVADGGKDLIRLEPASGLPQLRLSEAAGSYRLLGLDLAGNVTLSFDQARVLPFLRKLKGGDAAGFTDRLQQYLSLKIKKNTLSGRQVEVEGELTLNFAGTGATAGGPLLKAEIAATLDLDSMLLRFASDTVAFRVDQDDIALPSLLGLDWRFRPPPPRQGGSRGCLAPRRSAVGRTRRPAAATVRQRQAGRAWIYRTAISRVRGRRSATVRSR